MENSSSISVSGTSQSPLQNSKLFPKLTKPSSGSPSCSRKVFLTIIVLSQPENFHQRNTIRGSWGSLKIAEYVRLKLRQEIPAKRLLSSQIGLVKVVFVVGKSKSRRIQGLVNTESKIFQDIVFEDFIEKYNLLSLKTV